MSVFSKHRLIFILTSVLFFVCCKGENKMEIKTKTIDFTKEGELQIFKTATDSLLINLDIEFAETDYEVQTGLMYRASLEENQGMLFIFSESAMHSFFMKNTTIPLDIIFIDENFKIASFQKNTIPLNETGLSSQVPIQYVLEVNAGLSDKLNFAITDSISFKRLD